MWLKFVDMGEDEFMAQVDPQRDPQIWQRDGDGRWQALDSIANHIDSPQIRAARLPLKENVRREFPAGRYDLNDQRWLTEYTDYKIL
jgi:hypothetical protein